jgi:RNA polymerase sigma factor (sigma-70 family)
MNRYSCVLTSSKKALRVIELTKDLTVVFLTRAIALLLLISLIVPSAVSAPSKPLNSPANTARIGSLSAPGALLADETAENLVVCLSHKVLPIIVVRLNNVVGVSGVQSMARSVGYAESGYGVRSASGLAAEHTADTLSVARPMVVYWSSDRNSPGQSTSSAQLPRRTVCYGNAPWTKGDVMIDRTDRKAYLVHINLARHGDIDARDDVVLDPEIEDMCRRLYARRVYRERHGQLRDMVQIARVAIMESIASARKEFESVERFYGWAWTVAKRACLRSDHIARGHFSDCRIEDAPEGSASLAVQPTCEDQLILKETWDAVRAMLPRKQQVFVLSFVEGLRQVEIARILGCTRQTVRRDLNEIQQVLAPPKPERT